MVTVPWPRHPVVYEINTRVWLRGLAAQAGRPLGLGDVPEAELRQICDQGFDAVWLMGVWTCGALPLAQAREPGLLHEYQQALPDVQEGDIIGSPYAVSAYTVAPDLGGPAALQALRARLAHHGVRLILDFVSNHTACDHPLVTERPEVFVSGTEADLAAHPDAFFRTPDGGVLAHGRDPYFPPWRDTVAINYAGDAGRDAMQQTLLSIAAQCDGVRCDMAMLILPEVSERLWGARLGGPARAFWAEAIAAVRGQHPRFLFLAEAYWGMEPALHAQGFHYTYDKTLYDRLVHGDAAGVRQWLRRDLGEQQRCARFTENHDEPRALSALGPARAPGAALLSLCAPGLRLLHEGQLDGRRIKLPVQLGRAPQEVADPVTRAFYKRLLRALRHPDFHGEGFAAPDIHAAGPGDRSCQDLVALSWQGARPDAMGHIGHLIVVNLGGHKAYARIPLHGAVQPGGRYLLEDVLDGARYEREGTELRAPGLFVALPAHGAHLFQLSAR